MRKLLNKITALFTAIMMVGLYVPPTTLNPEASDEKDSNVIGESSDDYKLATLLDENEESSPADHLVEKAKEVTLHKLGSKIASKVEDELLEEIWPQMEDVIHQIMLQADESMAPYFEITTNPAPGDGERIFNLRNALTKEDIAKFHVRRDKRPLEGYWFNFHYHLNTDKFENHHSIGDIYWDKNTPPQWMVH